MLQSSVSRYTPGLTRVVQQAAIAAAPFRGKGDKNAADKAATEAMRAELDELDACFTVVIGEGERDEAPMLFIGERLGKGGLSYDLAVDPLEGTTPCASFLPRSWTTLAVAPSGKLLGAPDCYMDKVASGPKCVGLVSIDMSPTQNIEAVADALDKKVDDVVVCILNRSRNQQLIDEVRATGASIHLIEDGDVFGCIATAFPELGIDAYMGIGAAPEGVLAAAALKGLGGTFEGRLWFSDDELGRSQKQRAIKMGHDINVTLHMDDIVKTDDVMFFACGVTDGELVNGVSFGATHVTTEAMVINGLNHSCHFITDIRRQIS